MEDKNTPLYKKISEKYNYKDMHNINPLKPLVLWANTNTMLDNYYRQPHINLTNNLQDNNIRNTMRHFTGLALARQEYSKPITNLIGGLKEYGDLLKEYYFEDPKFSLSNKYFTDSVIDDFNNKKGMEYVQKNYNVSPMQIMDSAYDLAKQQKGLYELLTE